MKLNDLKNAIRGIDIYLLDQILKNRYAKNDIILDAGCGDGRNLKWFYKNDFTIYGVDKNETIITSIKKRYKAQETHFFVHDMDALSFEDDLFDHVICNAVLHFARDKEHFIKMFSELVRVLKPSGSLFIRVTTDEGMRNYISLVGDGVYHLPDGTDRFLLTKDLLAQVLNTFKMEMIEPLKYVNVDRKRSMATLILRKLNS